MFNGSDLEPRNRLGMHRRSFDVGGEPYAEADVLVVAGAGVMIGVGTCDSEASGGTGGVVDRAEVEDEVGEDYCGYPVSIV